jgi:hypothetical protein
LIPRQLVNRDELESANNHLNSDVASSVLQGSFGIDDEYVRSSGIRDANSDESSEMYREGRLTAEQRLHCSLSEAGILNQCLFEPKQVILRRGQAVELACFIVTGALLARRDNQIFRLGGDPSWALPRP